MEIHTLFSKQLGQNFFLNMKPASLMHFGQDILAQTEHETVWLGQVLI